MEEQVTGEQVVVDIPPVGALDPLNEARNLLGSVQFNLQVVTSALVLERQSPILLAGDYVGRNNYLCQLLANTLDTIPHIMEHLNNG